MSEEGSHLDLDEAWQIDSLPRIDARQWGPRLRFSASPRLIEKFYREIAPGLGPYILYGSGDFHHLSALWVRRISEPVVIVAFDNHPDWDVRPPRWCCGSWVNRALELPQVKKISVWGCGNFECWWPRRLFGNRRAEREGTLDLHPWADGRSSRDRDRAGAILRDTWRGKFEQFINEIHDTAVYITVDMDCFRPDEAVTNWESGTLKIVDVKWALEKLRKACRVVGGDLCGAYSPPSYARAKQRFISEIDHPKLRLPDPQKIREINARVFESLWPALTG